MTLKSINFPWLFPPTVGTWDRGTMRRPTVTYHMCLPAAWRLADRACWGWNGSSCWTVCPSMSICQYPSLLQQQKDTQHKTVIKHAKKTTVINWSNRVSTEASCLSQHNHTAIWQGRRVTDGRVVSAGISVTWNVLSWSGGHEFEPQLRWTWGAWYFCPKSYLNQHSLSRQGMLLQIMHKHNFMHYVQVRVNDGKLQLQQ